MGGFDALIRSMLGVADDLTTSLQAGVQHSAWVRSAENGDPEFDPPVLRMALIEEKQSLHHDENNESVMTKTKVTFLHPIPANGAVGRKEPVDPRDRILLPDGTTGPILSVDGMTDPTTNMLYMVEVMLG